MIKKLRIEYQIIISVLIFNFLLHLIADFNAGYHGDELLYIESGKHLAAGYMDFSPLIAYLAFIQNIFHSSSIFVNHFFLHLATALILLICGLITIDLGGKRFSLLATLLCIMFSPGLGATQSLFLPDVFDQLAWTSCLYFILRFCKEARNQYLILIGITAALGFLTKYTIVFLIGGMFLSLLIFNFNLLKKKILWVSLAFFLIIISPNVIWQLTNKFPLIHHFSKLYQTQLGDLSLINELKSMFLYLNPLSSIFWITGLAVVPFVRYFKSKKLYTYSLLFAFIFLFLAKGKSYYYFPIILGVLPLGTLFFEQIFNRRKWILTAYLSLTCLVGALMLPHGMPVIPLDKYVKYYKLKKNSYGRIPLPFANFYSKPVWNEILGIVSKQYCSLSPEEQKNCLIWGRHYSQAGIIDLLGKKFGLPEAFSFHGSFFNWVPDFSNNKIIIVISDFSWDKNHWLRYFDYVEEIDTIENIYASDNEWFKQHIFLCRNLKYNSSELKNMFKNEIF